MSFGGIDNYIRASSLSVIPLGAYLQTKEVDDGGDKPATADAEFVPSTDDEDEESKYAF